MNPSHAVSAQQFFGYIESFIEYRTTIYDISEQTVKSNRIDIKLFKDFLDMKDYQLITGKAVMDFQYYLKQQRLNCGASMNRKLFTLRAYSQYLKGESIPYVDALPFADILKCRQGYRSRPNALTKQQVKLFFDSIEQNNCMAVRNYAIYATMYKLGLRVGEVHQLDLEHIDVDNRKIMVTGKGKKQRTLHLDDEMMAVLIQWFAVRKQFLNHDTESALFISKKGNRLAIRTIEDNFQQLLKNVTLNVHFHVTCHSLRHAFASHLNDEDVDILVIQDLLGHATPKTTADYYIHPSEKRVRKALEKMSGVIYMTQLVNNGFIKFQSSYQKRE
ncbi:tyrosine-type recombinase/integrase [candidate division KSB1 bacterium]|nr:tyrosine-type recombinase/integrase [candidate division KSB1 bacterium]